MEFFASCGTGLEPVLGDELRRLGVAQVRPLTGGVAFGSGLEDAYRALLWSRVASRVLVTLTRTGAADADALYEGARAVRWEDHLQTGATIAVAAHGGNDALRDTRFIGLRVKDAIVDRLRELRGERPDVDAKHPDALVDVRVHRDRATISLDLSGGSLEDRGYRVPGNPHGAPMRENLAAALLLALGWGKPSLRGALFYNPLAANGTVAIEAALIAGDIAPGIARERWGFGGWAVHDQSLWEKLLDEADERAEQARKARSGNTTAPQVVACDPDPAALDHARRCARRASVADAIRFEVSAGAVLPPEALPGHDRLVCACNASCSTRAPRAQLPVLYSALSPLVAASEACGLLSDDPDLDAFLGMTAARVFAVKNGSADAMLRVYEAPSEGASAEAARVEIRGRSIPVNDAGAQQFASRLNKVVKARRKWAHKAEVSACRVYDADLPDYNMAIDVYRGAGPCEGQTRVHVAEYAPPKQIEPEKAARRMADALRIIPLVLDVEPEDVFVKRRVRARGGSQYAGAAGSGGSSRSGGSEAKGPGAQNSGAKVPGARSPRFITQEHGLLFEVDLADYLDTGLFLDHRATRALIGALVKGKRFLNLFAYTATASVYAAAAGAKSTTTVDLSNTYLAWGERNMRLNGLFDRQQEFVRADVLQWVNDMRHSPNRWDLVFCDPPTFSNSAKMGGRSWDVQRDHVELLIDVSRLLTRGGAAIFSCNLRKFKIDAAALAKAGVQVVDITPKTIPPDFERNPKVHHCYLLRRL